nr:HNH endonuclease signature motif containing protein [Rhodococcus sp. (in: high G+C Gram-positive bacteria)]
MSIVDDRSVLAEVLGSARVAHAAVAASLADMARFYESRSQYPESATDAKFDDRIVHTSAVAELAAALATTYQVVDELLRQWWALTPLVKDALCEGRFGLQEVRKIREHTLGAHAELVRELESEIVRCAIVLDPPALGREIDRLLNDADPDWDRRSRKRAAATEPKVRITALARGMGRVSATVTGAESVEMAQRIEAELKKVCPRDPRSLDFLRAQAVVVLCRKGSLSCDCGDPDCVLSAPDLLADDGAQPKSGEGSDSDPSATPGDIEKPSRDNPDDEDRADRDVADRGMADRDVTDRDAAGEHGPGERGAGEGSDGEDPGSEGPGNPVPGGGPGGGGPGGGGPDGGGPDSGGPDGGGWSGGGVGAEQQGSPAAAGPTTACTCAADARSAKPAYVIHISADLETILGVGNRAAHLHGYGPIDAATAREMAADASWQITFTASRKYLDLLTGGDNCLDDVSDWDPPDPPTNSGKSTAACECTCCDHDCDADDFDNRIAHFLDQAMRRDNNNADEFPDGVSGPTAQERRDDLDRLRELAEDHARKAGTECDLVLGRTRKIPAGFVPPNPPPSGERRRGAGKLIQYWRQIVESNPGKSHAVYADGHGGHRTPPPGALNYTPGAALAALVRAEHPMCMHPGCSVPSARCDLDHIVEFDHDDPAVGGWTIRTNLGPFCRLHHNLKTAKAWFTERLPEGVMHLTDPLGNHYFSAPEL